MSKKFAQIRTEMWFDGDIRSLTIRAQHLYLLLSTHPDRSYAGVVDWRPNRIKEFAAEWSAHEVMLAAAEASDRHFLVFDQDTEEVLVRSFVRHDGLLKQPRMCVSVANAWGAIASNKLRAALVYELLRLKKEMPDLEGWEKPQMKTVLRQDAFNAKDMPTELDLSAGVPFAPGLGSGLPLGLGLGLPQTQDDVSGLATPFTSTIHHPPATSSIEDAASSGLSYPQGSAGRSTGGSISRSVAAS